MMCCLVDSYRRFRGTLHHQGSYLPDNGGSKHLKSQTLDVKVIWVFQI